MSVEDVAKELGAAVGIALAEGVKAALESGGDLDAGYARMIEKLSDARLSRKVFPDGRYVPPEV